MKRDYLFLIHGLYKMKTNTDSKRKIRKWKCKHFSSLDTFRKATKVSSRMYYTFILKWK